MVVASGGWVQNASCTASGQNNPNLNGNNTQSNNNKMTAKGILICQENSHPFQERTLTLDQPVKVGRSVARARAMPNNAIFDCKVLSRSHALLWYSAGKFYLQDTRSSNGTFLNNERLSPSGSESHPKEVCSGDIVQFGVDVVESTKKVTHGCIIAALKLYLPDGKEAKPGLTALGTSSGDNVSIEDLYKLNQFMQDASRREKALCSKLVYLQQLVENTRQVANQSWKAQIAEDRLLSWVETIECQLEVYSKHYTEDNIRNEIIKLQAAKADYQNVAKEALQKILQEKLEVTQKLVQLEGRLSETEEECQSLHDVAKYTETEFRELCSKYTEAQKKLQETTNKLMESEEKIKDIVQSTEQEKQELLKKLEDQSRIEGNLQARLRDSRLDSVNIYKQITVLRNYIQTLQDMNPKFVVSDIMDVKEEENPIEAINAILNKLNSIHADNVEVDTDVNFYPSKSEQENEINSQGNDYNQLKNSDISFSKNQIVESLENNESLTEYILPPPSRRILVNGNVSVENSDLIAESDTNSDITDDTCSINNDDISEKSVVEVKKGESLQVVEETIIPHKTEVRFATEEVRQELEVQNDQAEPRKNTEVLETETETAKNTQSSVETNLETDICEEKVDNGKDAGGLDEDCEDEHLEGDYVKTLKPLSSPQQNLHTKEYILQTLIGSLDYLKSEDTLESQQAVKKELEDLKDWLLRESHEAIVDKLKELYYRAKNEAQRIQEVNEELVILKEKYNTFVEEKAELSKKYTALKTQCGDLLNTAYTIPIHYVAPLAIVLIYMLLDKIF